VSSSAEAVRAIERFASFEHKLPNKQHLGSWLAALQDPSLQDLENFTKAIKVEFPEQLLSNSQLLFYYGGCTVTRFGSSQLAVKFGDGVIPHELHTFMQLPSIVVAEQRNFHLKHIPDTKGAKAFSIDAAAKALAELFRSHPQLTTTGLNPNLTIAYDNETFATSFDLFCHRLGSERYHNDLVIFPCCGHEVPRPFRERLVMTVAPVLTGGYKTTHEMSLQSAKLLHATSIITSGLQELFGMDSPTRLKSVAPIVAEP
jgi:hypothetical protein